VLEMASDICRTHHERWDGRGYPSGLRQNNIPTSGTITSIADSFDVMISSRPYKKEILLKEAFDDIRLNSGRQFSPLCAYSLLSLRTRISPLYVNKGESVA
jgi:putative two-component system response regulator